MPSHRGFLSKRIPAYTKTVKFKWIYPNWMLAGTLREARISMKDPLNKCFWCKRLIRDHEYVNLACPEKGKNVVLCEECTKEALGNE